MQTRWERLTRLEAHAATDGVLTERTRRRPQRPHVEAQRLGDLVCLDAFYVGKLKGVGKVWQLTACDTACSYGIATLVPRVTQQVAIQFLRAHVVPACARAGHRILVALTGGGPEWQVRFVATYRELGITHRRTRLRHAWTTDEIVKAPAGTGGECEVRYWWTRVTLDRRAEHGDGSSAARVRFDATP